MPTTSPPKMSTLGSMSKRPKSIGLIKDRKELLYLARLAASGGRFDHMYDYMKRLIEIVSPAKHLTVQERECFSWACNAHIKDKRDAYHHVAKIAADCAGIDQKRADAANAYLPTMAKEIDAICRDVLKTINVYFLLPDRRANTESLISYRTMKGNFFSYLAEVNTGSESRELVDLAHRSYLSAKIDERRLPATNPTRLDMRFSLAHFMCDVLQTPYEGYKFAQEGYEFAAEDLEAAGEVPSHELAAALDRLQHFLILWKDYAT